MFFENQFYFESSQLFHPVYLYLIFEKSSLKNQVRRTGFLQATQAVKIQFEINKKIAILNHFVTF